MFVFSNCLKCEQLITLQYKYFFSNCNAHIKNFEPSIFLYSKSKHWVATYNKNISFIHVPSLTHTDASFCQHLTPTMSATIVSVRLRSCFSAISSWRNVASRLHTHTNPHTQCQISLIHSTDIWDFNLIYQKLYSVYKINVKLTPDSVSLTCIPLHNSTLICTLQLQSHHHHHDA